MLLIYTGQIGITVAIGYADPADMYNPADLLASEIDLDFDVGWFIHPIYVNGDYPDLMKQAVWAKSFQQGYNSSRLPEFTAEEKERINGRLRNNNIHNEYKGPKCYLSSY